MVAKEQVSSFMNWCVKEGYTPSPLNVKAWLTVTKQDVKDMHDIWSAIDPYDMARRTVKMVQERRIRRKGMLDRLRGIVLGLDDTY